MLLKVQGSFKQRLGPRVLESPERFKTPSAKGVFNDHGPALFAALGVRALAQASLKGVDSTAPRLPRVTYKPTTLLPMHQEIATRRNLRESKTSDASTVMKRSAAEISEAIAESLKGLWLSSSCKGPHLVSARLPLCCPELSLVSSGR